MLVLKNWRCRCMYVHINICMVKMSKIFWKIKTFSNAICTRWINKGISDILSIWAYSRGGGGHLCIALFSKQNKEDKINNFYKKMTKKTLLGGVGQNDSALCRSCSWMLWLHFQVLLVSKVWIGGKIGGRWTTTNFAGKLQQEWLSDV